ncbi:MAG: 2,3-bisphosphoglycerate-independent phosphoglycerate mutase, partial [Vicinamibacterales bacterium]
FDSFDRVVHPKVHCTTMTEYEQTYGLPIAFATDLFTGSLAEVLQAAGVTNLRLAETEKYAHVTYFFNCGEERPYRGEERLLVPSPKVATYDLKPEMSAIGITDALVADIEGRRHLAVICNYANADMVGHTGRLDAAIAAVQTLDACLGRIATAVERAGGVLIVTADHGNAEQMWDSERNAPHTAHTSNPVPVILIDEDARGRRLRDGSLRDVAPTLLSLLSLEVSPEMTGRSLISE